MQVLNPTYYRSKSGESITRANVDSLLDSGSIETAMRNGNWWTIRRNGKTRTWKRDATRIAIPFKAGMYTYGTIFESDFVESAS